MAIVGRIRLRKIRYSQDHHGSDPDTSRRDQGGSQILFEGGYPFPDAGASGRNTGGKDCAIIFQDALAALNPTMTIGNQVAEKLLIHTSMSRAEAWGGGRTPF